MILFIIYIDILIVNLNYMEYNFKKFDNRNVRLEDRITITKSYSIGLPSKFYSDNNIKNYKYASLYWEDEKKLIGIAFNNIPDKNNFSITHSKIGYGGSIIAKSFFKTYNIDTQECHGRYTWKKEIIDTVGDMFIINIDEKRIAKENINEISS